MKPGDVFPAKPKFYCVCQGICERCEERESDPEESDSKGKYLQEIRCERCEALLGYAPYWRADYLCVACNVPTTREKIKAHVRAREP